MLHPSSTPHSSTVREHCLGGHWQEQERARLFLPSEEQLDTEFEEDDWRSGRWCSQNLERAWISESLCEEELPADPEMLALDYALSIIF